MYSGVEEFSHFNKDGSAVYPSGPCCMWPRERGLQAMKQMEATGNQEQGKDKKIEATLGEMTKSLFNTTVDFITDGKVDANVQKLRYESCLKCPHFIESSKQCSKCGCYMPIKTSVKKATCPIGIW